MALLCQMRRVSAVAAATTALKQQMARMAARPAAAAAAAATMGRGVGVRRMASAASTAGKRKKGRKVVDSMSGPEAFQLALKKVEKDFGTGTVMKLGSRPKQKVDVLSSGSLSIDAATGIGGWPRGRVVEIYGPESSGKTTVALHTVAECQKAGGTAIFVDAEHALDAGHAASLGVRIDDLYVSQPDDGESALEVVDTMVKSGGVDLIVVDSVAALAPRAELAGEMGDSHIALQARLMSQALRKLTATVAKTNCIIMFINQVRKNVGVVFGSGEVTAGGMALRFYSSMRMEIRRIGQIKKDNVATGNMTRIKMAKNKLAPPFSVAEFDIVFGEGIDKKAELLDLGEKVGVVQKAGAWYSLILPDVGLPPNPEDGSDVLRLGQGRDNSRAFLAENPEIMQALDKTLRHALLEDDSTVGLLTDVNANLAADEAAAEEEEEEEATATDDAHAASPAPTA